MADIVETIDIDAPVERVYAEWADLTGLPRILNFVEEVTATGPDHFHFKLNIAGQTREYDAHTTEQIENERIAWASEGGETPNAGVVTFHRLSDTTSRLTLQMDWTPENLADKAAALVQVDDLAVKGDLRKFKETVEAA